MLLIGIHRILDFLIQLCDIGFWIHDAFQIGILILNILYGRSNLLIRILILIQLFASTAAQQQQTQERAYNTSYIHELSPAPSSIWKNRRK